MAGSIGDGGGTGNIGDLEPGYGGALRSIAQLLRLVGV